MSSPAPIEDKGYIVRNLNICLVTFSTIFIAVRCYVRVFVIKSMGWDDTFAIMAWTILVTIAGLEVLATMNGTGRHVQDVPHDQLVRWFVIIPTSELLYFVAIALVRLSIVAVLPRICIERKINRFVWGLGIVVFLLSAVSFLVLLFECKHVPDRWHKLSPNINCAPSNYEQYLFRINAGIGTCVDLVLFAAPIWLIYSRMVFSKAAIKVILVFSVGLFVVITGIIRLVIILTLNFAEDITFKFVKLSTWADLEIHIGFWVACFPSLTPLIRIAAKKIGMATPSSGTENKTSNAWENKTRGYVKSGHESNVHHERGSVFDDDSSTKKIVHVDESDTSIEMDQIRCTTNVVMVDERDIGIKSDRMLSTRAYASETR